MTIRDPRTSGRAVWRRRNVIAAAGAWAVADLAASAHVRADAASSLTLKLGHSGSQQWQGNLWATTFASAVSRHIPGAKVEIFPNAQLGQDPALAQAVKLGTLDITVNGPVLQEYVPALAVMDLPFLFDNMEAAHKVLDGPVGNTLRDDFERAGFRFLGPVDIGMRDVTNNRRPINTVADFKGLKLRVPPGKVFVATFEALGASVQSIDFGELYTALQQGVVDGEENPPTTVRVQKLYEVQKYLSLTRHIASFAYAVMNARTYKRQPAAVRQVLDAAGAAATQATRVFLAQDGPKSLDFLRTHGMLINEPTDRESFRKATRDVIREAPPAARALGERIMKPS